MGIGRIVDLDVQQIRVGKPMNLNYLLDADGSDYSKKHLTTSSVTNLNKLERKLIIETANSIFEFEKLKIKEVNIMSNALIAKVNTQKRINSAAIF